MRKMVKRLLSARGARGEAAVVGAFDGLIDGFWQGWALDRQMPGRALTVTLLTRSGRRIAAEADHYRADVHRAMPGHGHYGFRIPDEVLAGEEPVEVVVEGTGVTLRLRGREGRGACA